MKGNEGFSGLLQEMVDVLSTCAAFRFKERGDAGSISQSEIDGMISVTSVDFAENKYDMDFGN